MADTEYRGCYNGRIQCGMIKYANGSEWPNIMGWNPNRGPTGPTGPTGPAGGPTGLPGLPARLAPLALPALPAQRVKPERLGLLVLPV